ncbi:MAG TPA: cytochrome c-type biogenesis protein CcmH [Longimicrobium sp.]|nr:cytochrome c-type biogenesis protein CcmH [Longimicrobium sp.]
MRIRAILATAAAAALWAAAPVCAQGSGDRAHDVARAAEEQLRSPVTPSHTLDMCPSPEAQALRDSVLTMAAGGMTSGQIVEAVIARRGEQLRIVPEQRGVGLWAWILPPAVLVIGAGVVAYRLNALRRQRAGMAPEAERGISEVERAQVEAALRQFERGEVGG